MCLIAALVSVVLLDEPAPKAEAPKVDAEVTAFLDAWAKKTQGIRSIVMRFRQEKKLKILRRPRVSHGELTYADGKLSVIVKGADGEVESELTLKDGVLKIQYPRLKREEVMEVGKGGSGGTSFFFASDPRDAPRDYVVRLKREGKLDTLTLEPRDAKSPVKRLELVFEDFEMREYHQIDASGDELRMIIESAQTTRN